MIHLLTTIMIISLNTMMVFDFNKDCDLSQWQTVDDVVMGGRSESKIYLNAAGNAIFSGKVSLENNGGFSSVRYAFRRINISGYFKFIIRLKGDGKTYQFRAKASNNQYYTYTSNFSTSKDWQVIEIPFKSLQPEFRGRQLDMQHFEGEYLSETGFLIANKKAEEFKLEIDKIEIQ